MAVTMVSSRGRWSVFHAFDSAYIDRLRDRDPQTEQHFVAYFSDLITIKLRARMRSKQLVEDVKQETFLRVLRTLRSPDGIQCPERLGAFVSSVCNNVMLEHLRSQKRHVTEPEETVSDLSEPAGGPHDAFVTEERKSQVRRIINGMPDRDRGVLRAVFLEEKDRDEVCAQLGIDRGYLRVLLHRAKTEFRKDFLMRQGSRGVDGFWRGGPVPKEES